jgi:carbon monoxide dehydrogenase subunit G
MTRAVTRGSGAGCALVLAAALMAALPARAGGDPATGTVGPADLDALDAVAVAAAPEAPVVHVTRGDSGLVVEGSCRVEASPADVWDVLTDYDGIDRFVSNMRESRVSGHGDGYVMVEQVAVGGLLLYRKKLHATLRVVEEPHHRIQFEDVLHRDFVSYRGEWRIVESGDGVEIIYRVGAQPRFAIPDFIARGMFRGTVRDLLAQVAAEVDRRAGLARRPSPRSDATPAMETGGAELAVRP